MSLILTASLLIIRGGPVAGKGIVCQAALKNRLGQMLREDCGPALSRAVRMCGDKGGDKLRSFISQLLNNVFLHTF